MNQLGRLIATLTLLKSKRILTATELSNKFDVSVRTVYRDIRKLEETGVPIITLEGRGYSLMDGYTIAPVQFTEKQANALITAQQIIKQSKDTSFVHDFEEAMTKIKSVFRSSIREKSELLSDNIYVFNNHYENTSSNVLSEIQLAITNFNLVEIHYAKVYTDEKSFRTIEACAMYASQNKWVLIAWCHLRKDYRAFRIDKIKHFKVLPEKFEDRKFSLSDYHKAENYGK